MHFSKGRRQNSLGIPQIWSSSSNEQALLTIGILEYKITVQMYLQWILTNYTRHTICVAHHLWQDDRCLILLGVMCSTLEVKFLKFRNTSGVLYKFDKT